MQQFYRDVASRFLKRGWLHFSCLTIDNKVVSAEYGFVYNRKLFAATAARDQWYSRYSVGHLHLMYLIKDAIRKGLQEFDFLKGDEPYKFYWTRSFRRYLQVVIIGKGFSAGLRLKLLHAFLRSREIRQCTLREAYSLYQMKRKEKKEKKMMGLKNIAFTGKSLSNLFPSILKISVPFVDNLPFDKLAELREKEKNTFLDFQMFLKNFANNIDYSKPSEIRKQIQL